MKERPILFNSEMVRAVLEGRKTQTRRVIKPQPQSIDVNTLKTIPYNGSGEYVLEQRKCPYGKVGDRLWVRETHYRYGKWIKNGFTSTGKQAWKFKPLADAILHYNNAPSVVCTKKSQIGWFKRPSIFMPHYASRITLEVVSVKVERVQEISEEDAKAEGVTVSTVVEMADGSPCYSSPFFNLWTQIHGIDNPKSLESNPWVWVVEFKVIKR